MTRFSDLDVCSRERILLYALIGTDGLTKFIRVGNMRERNLVCVRPLQDKLVHSASGQAMIDALPDAKVVCPSLVLTPNGTQRRSEISSSSEVSLPKLLRRVFASKTGAKSGRVTDEILGRILYHTHDAFLKSGYITIYSDEVVIGRTPTQQAFGGDYIKDRTCLFLDAPKDRYVLTEDDSFSTSPMKQDPWRKKWDPLSQVDFPHYFSMDIPIFIPTAFPILGLFSRPEYDNLSAGITRKYLVVLATLQREVIDMMQERFSRSRRGKMHALRSRLWFLWLQTVAYHHSKEHTHLLRPALVYPKEVHAEGEKIRQELKRLEKLAKRSSKKTVEKLIIQPDADVEENLPALGAIYIDL